MTTYPNFDYQAMDDSHGIWVGRLPSELLGGPALFESLWNLHPAEFHDVRTPAGTWVKTPRWQQAYGRDYAIEKGVIRQFVAQPLGAGFSVEEQLTGQAEWGGIQFQAHPFHPDTYWRETLREEVDSAWDEWLHPRQQVDHCMELVSCCYSLEEPSPSMGLAAGGRMKQEIYADRRDPSDYLTCTGNRCFVHLCNSEQWELITGQAPPHRPPTADDYSRRGLPWFDYYDEKQSALPGGDRLSGIKSVKQIESETGEKVLPPLPDEAKPKVIVKYIKE